MTLTETTVLDAALAYAARGWRVIPIAPGHKHPKDFPAWQRVATTDPDTIRTWWTERPHHGIGIVTGAASGIWVLDVDVADGKAGDETLDEHEATYGPLPSTYEVVTGSGGRHLYFDYGAVGHEIRNSASGRLGPGLDVRGEGGFVVAPPTIHPNGLAYETEASAPDTVAIAPAWLVGMLQAPEPAQPRPLQPAADTGDRPGDIWAAATDWAQILEPDGWQLDRTDRNGERHWVRPGKDRREGTSATTGYGDADVLKVFTSSLTHLGLEAEGTYTKLGYLAATRFAGDHAAAASHLRAQGHHRPTPALDDLIGASLKGNATPATQQAPEPWPEPTPLPAPAPLPPFPLHVLPEFAQAHALAAADARQVPVDMCAMLAIGSIAAAATGRLKVEIADGWEEPCNLYLTVAMRSGAGKSPAEKAMAGWLRRWERERMAAMAPAHDEATILAKAADKRYRKMADGALADPADILNAAREAQEARDRIPPLPRLIIDDTTPEAVAVLLKEYGERLAILSTEADLFDMLLRGKPSQRPNLNVYLKAWGGDELRRDRKGGSESGPETTMLTEPLLTVSVTVQPSVLARLQHDEEMVGRGFSARFMFAMPTDLMGHRDQRRRFRAGTLTTAPAYEDAARALAERWATWARPAILALSDDAAGLFEDFMVELEPRLALGADLERLAEWVAKLTASVARYAGLLHAAEGADIAAPITGATMARAIDLGHYWLTHAIAVAGLAEDFTIEQADAIISYIAELGVGELTLSEIQKGLRRPALKLDTVADYVPAVDLLVEHGWLRSLEPGDWHQGVGVRRSKSPSFAVLPSVIGNSRKAHISRSQSFALWESANSPSSSPPSQPPSTDAIRELREQPDGPPPTESTALPALALLMWGDDTTTQEPS